MEEDNCLCLTPIRATNRVLKERQIQNEARRSLFEKGDSDLSDISPLSRTSSELLSPVHTKSPIKIVTPLRVRGVCLLSPDRGIIKPTSFYGGSKSACATLDGAEMYRQIRKSLPENSKARTCLFLDNLPRNKKRSRSSGNPDFMVKQAKKKIKLQPNLKHDVRRPSKSELRQRDILKRKKAIRELKERKLKEKLNKPNRKYSWEVFNTNEELNKFTWRSSVVLTPPRSSKKKRLMATNMEYLSPIKLETDLQEAAEDHNSEEGDSNVNELVKEIREGVFDMMKDDDDDEVSLEVGALIDRLSKKDEELINENEKNTVELTVPVIADEENIDPSTPPKEKMFPIFSTTPKNTVLPVLTSSKSEPANHKKKFGMGLDQLQLDVGQNKLREIECSGCGLMYIQGNPEDMAEHEIFHFKFKELHFNGWKNERVVRFDGSNKIVCVRDSDNWQWWKKATNVLEVIDSELGYPPNGPPPTQIYMYISGKFIRGLAAVSHITTAYKMLHIEGSEVGLCSEEEYPVKCLISRMWVDHHFRRCNIATTLLDSVRSNFAFGYIMKCSDLAFSSPTDDGRKFIEKYTKTKEYFVIT